MKRVEELRNQKRMKSVKKCGDFLKLKNIVEEVGVGWWFEA